MPDISFEMLPPVEIEGKGAFVTLHYHGASSSRNEHSIVFFPKEWITLKELLRTPQEFIYKIFRSYLSRPTTHPWDVSGPITISVQPLTELTQDNAILYSFLARWYPKFGTILSPELSPSSAAQFRQAVIDAAKKPQEFRDEETFALTYVLEFALGTRHISIKYIPQAPSSSPVVYPRITDVTISKMSGTPLAFIHFDIDFDGNQTHPTVATARSELAFNYIWQPSSLNTVLNQPNLVFVQTNGIMTDTGKPLLEGPKPYASKPTLQMPTTEPIDPTVLLDSVERLPDSNPPPPPPIPSVCGKLTVKDLGSNNYQLGSLLVKGYGV